MDVKVNIRTKQYDNNGYVDIINLDTVANLYNKNNDIYIVYKEEIEGLKTTTTIKISDDEVSIKKFGNTNSNMILKEGYTHTNQYRTPQGIFVIETKTNKLDINKDINNSIKVNIEYDINIMDLFKGKNEIDINIQI